MAACEHKLLVVKQRLWMQAHAFVVYMHIHDPTTVISSIALDALDASQTKTEKESKHT
jgi:hypothetical protein